MIYLIIGIGLLAVMAFMLASIAQIKMRSYEHIRIRGKDNQDSIDSLRCVHRSLEQKFYRLRDEKAPEEKLLLLKELYLSDSVNRWQNEQG